jgi:hypothetical protein
MSEKVRDLSELLKNPTQPLTDYEKAHFDECTAFKNHDKSAKDVSVAKEADRACADFIGYAGFGA